MFAFYEKEGIVRITGLEILGVLIVDGVISLDMADLWMMMTNSPYLISYYFHCELVIEIDSHCQ
jgi:hypothetical protein